MANRIRSIDCFQGPEDSMTISIARERSSKWYHRPQGHHLAERLQQLVSRSVDRGTADVTIWSIGIVGWTVWPRKVPH